MSWNRFFGQFQKDLKLWGFGVGYFSLYRLLFIFLFRRKMADGTGALDVLAACLNGVRFDSVVMTAFALATFLFLSVPTGFIDIGRVADRVRFGLAVAFFSVTTILCRVAIGFFEEYDDNFNHWIYGLWYDDAGAIFKTVGSQYSVVVSVIAVGVVIVGCVLALRRWLRRPIVGEDVYARRLGTLPRRIGVTVAIVPFLVIGVRGSLGRRPMQLKDAAITKDAFLNKAVVNPYPALRYAFQQHRFLSAAHGVEAFLPGGDVRAAARLLFGGKDAPADLDAYMLTRAKGRGGSDAKPRHVFAIFVESYDAWPLLDKYASLGVAGEMKRLARDGLHVKRFLPSSPGTMSIGVIITGLPDVGVHVNYRSSGKGPYPTAIAPIMKRLGYRTRFFYGGYLSWQRIGDFAREQGFDEVYGGAHMGSYAATNEWGVDDEYTFEFARKTVADDPPSFNLILTTTNHPPYDVDVRAKGFPLGEVPEDMKPFFDGTVDLNTLGHLWYADRYVGGFVDDMTRKLTRPVFALTGDHFSRRFLNARPTFFERSAVPFVLYGPEVLRGLTLPAGAAGSHVDIAATLIELSAPEGFEYHAAGKSVLDPGARRLGIGSGTAVGPGFMVDVGAGALHPIPEEDPPAEAPDIAEIARLHGALHAVGWWRIMKGKELPGAP